jgi:hypothetical protein
VPIITYHAALPFKLMEDGEIRSGDAIECPSAETAIVSEEILSQLRATSVSSRSAEPGTLTRANSRTR